MSASDRRLTAKSSEFEVSEATKAAIGAIRKDVRDIQAGVHRGPGCSFALPFVMLDVNGGSWTFDLNGGGSLALTGPSGTVTVLGLP